MTQIKFDVSEMNEKELAKRDAFKRLLSGLHHAAEVDGAECSVTTEEARMLLTSLNDQSRLLTDIHNAFGGFSVAAVAFAKMSHEKGVMSRFEKLPDDASADELSLLTADLVELHKSVIVMGLAALPLKHILESVSALAIRSEEIGEMSQAEQEVKTATIN